MIAAILGAYAAVITIVLMCLLTVIRRHVIRSRDRRLNYAYLPNPPENRGLR